MAELECPRCHTHSEFGTLAQDAASFCPACDFPMFFAAEEVVVQGAAFDPAVDYRRRFPGVKGVSGIAPRACWYCEELNPAENGSTCWRCGNDLSGPPPTPDPVITPGPVPAPPSQIVEELEDEEPVDWGPWRLTAVLAALALLIFLAFLLLSSTPPASQAAAAGCSNLSGAVPFASVGARAAAISGEITDRLTGTAIRDATVVVTGPDGTQVAVPARDEGAVGGCYSVRSLPPGTYTAEFSAAGYDTATREFIVAEGDGRIELDAQLDIVETSVFGRVLTTSVTGTPTPVAGLLVILDVPPNVATTDTDGSFVITARAPAGRHQLLFRGDYTDAATVVTISEPGEPVAVGDITLVRLFTVEGALVDSFGRPLSEIADPPVTGEATVAVRAVRATGELVYETSFAIGEGFAFELPGPAMYDFTVTAPENAEQLSATSTTRMSIDADATVEDLVVPFAPGVAWGVVTSAGEPLPHATVQAVAVPGAAPIAMAQSDAQGRVTFGPLIGVETIWLKVIDGDATVIACSPDPTVDPDASSNFGTVDCTP